MRNPIYAILVGVALLSACATRPASILQAIDPAIRDAIVIERTVVRYDADIDPRTGLDQGQLSEVLGREFSERVRPRLGAAPHKVTVDVEILAYREPNAALAILLGDSAGIAGNAKVLDFETGAILGDYYIEVFESASGLVGLAVADKNENGLGREFVEHFVSYLDAGAAR